MTDPLEILDAIDRERGESFVGMIQANQVQLLRDEIVRLRAFKTRVFADVRVEVLEEAALVCDEPAKRLREELGWCAEAELLERYASAIRALKDKPR